MTHEKVYDIIIIFQLNSILVLGTFYFLFEVLQTSVEAVTFSDVLNSHVDTQVVNDIHKVGRIPGIRSVRWVIFLSTALRMYKHTSGLYMLGVMNTGGDREGSN